MTHYNESYKNYSKNNFTMIRRIFTQRCKPSSNHSLLRNSIASSFKYNSIIHHQRFYTTDSTSSPQSQQQQSQQSNEPTTPSEITIDDFIKVNLVIGTIKQVEIVPKSQKLFKIQVDIGNNQIRTILSGVRKFYPTQELIDNLLINKQCIVVENLKPRNMAGILSHGMILFTTGLDNEGNASIALVNPNNVSNQSQSNCIVTDGTRVM
jgi:methionine--tRNA ligase beta chain